VLPDIDVLWGFLIDVPIVYELLFALTVFSFCEGLGGVSRMMERQVYSFLEREVSV
jgi:hypothetical protein